MELVYNDGKSIYIHNGWPILEKGGVYFTPKGMYFTKKELVENLREEPEFTLPWYSFSGFNSNATEHRFIGYSNYRVEKIVVGLFVPSRPGFTERDTPGDLVPGFGKSLGKISLDGFFEVYNPVRVLEGGSYRSSASEIVYKNVVFADGIADLVIPWKDKTDALQCIRMSDVPKKYLRNRRKLPFSGKLTRGIKLIYSEHAWNGFDAYFIGWDDDITFAILMSEHAGGLREWKLYYNKKAPESSYNSLTPKNVLLHMDEAINVEEDDLRAVSSVDDLVDFVAF